MPVITVLALVLWGNLFKHAHAAEPAKDLVQRSTSATPVNCICPEDDAPIGPLTSTGGADMVRCNALAKDSCSNGCKEGKKDLCDLAPYNNPGSFDCNTSIVDSCSPANDCGMGTRRFGCPAANSVCAGLPLIDSCGMVCGTGSRNCCVSTGCPNISNYCNTTDVFDNCGANCGRGTRNCMGGCPDPAGTGCPAPASVNLGDPTGNDTCGNPCPSGNKTPRPTEEYNNQWGPFRCIIHTDTVKACSFNMTLPAGYSSYAVTFTMQGHRHDRDSSTSFFVSVNGGTSASSTLSAASNMPFYTSKNHANSLVAGPVTLTVQGSDAPVTISISGSIKDEMEASLYWSVKAIP